MSAQDRHSSPVPQALLALPALLGSLAFFAGPSPAAAQMSTEIRLCLQDYAMLTRSGDAVAALAKIRACGKAHPEEFALQKTLGKKLAELHEETGDVALAEEAVGAYLAAAKIDATKFASSFGDLAALQQALGRQADAIASWEQALPELMISERQGAQDALWLLYREAGEDAKALELWKELSYRQSDDFDSVRYAARLHQDSNRLDDAKYLWKRALELSPGDAGAQAAYNEILAATAASGSSADKTALLKAWIPRLGEADDAFLGELMAMTREVFNPEAERAIAQEMLMRDPASPQANLSMGEALLSEGDSAGAERALKKALAGGLSAADEGRAQAVLGRMVEQRTFAAYDRAPSKTGKDVINAALQGYQQALLHYGKAAAAGADVGDALENVRKAMRSLDGAVGGITELEVQAASKACSQLATDARFSYDRDKPIKRTLKAESALAASAGSSGDPSNTLAGGTEVSLMDARWDGGACWTKVKSATGQTGWLLASKTR